MPKPNIERRVGEEDTNESRIKTPIAVDRNTSTGGRDAGCVFEC